MLDPESDDRRELKQRPRLASLSSLPTGARRLRRQNVFHVAQRLAYRGIEIGSRGRSCRERKNRFIVDLESFNVIYKTDCIPIDRRRGSVRGARILRRVRICLNQDFFLWKKGHQDSVVMRVIPNQVEFQRANAVGEDFLVADLLDNGLLLRTRQAIGVLSARRERAVAKKSAFSSWVTIVAPASTNVRRPPA